MSTTLISGRDIPPVFGSLNTDSEVVELPLLLPRWQVAALEETARRHGLTTGQLIRRAVADLVRNSDPNGY